MKSFDKKDLFQKNVRLLLKEFKKEKKIKLLIKEKNASTLR